MKIRTISTRSLLSASLVSMSVLWLAGCGSGDDGTGVASGAGAHALGLGDSGPAVREVHDYLMRYGYFPNDELSASFPTWSPAVDQAPESPTLFDDRMEQGVFALQELSGLPRTGVVDEATANLMHTARCGVPDHVRSNNDKWAVDNVSWQQYGFTWSFNSSGQPSNLNTSDVLNSLTNMFARWSQRTGFIFTRQTSGGNIPITWAPLKSPSLGLTTCTYNKSTNRISVCKLQLSNADVSWSIGHPDGSQYDLESVALHEIGHAIGLDHSSQIPKPVPVPGFGPSLPVMVPGIPLGVVKSQLTLDDIEGVHALAKTLTVGALPNPPDGVGASSLLATPVGRVWALGSPTIGPGHRIWTFGSSGWTEHPFGGLATQLASTASGKLWAINSVGEIWTEGNGQWAKIDGAASHIAAAGNEVWHLSQAVTRGTKDHDIYRWNGSGWTQVAGYASEISAFIEPVFNTVQFWYVNGFGEVWGQGVFPDGTLGAPVALGKAPPGGACSPQASGRDGVFFALDCQQLASTGFSPPYVWNQQPQQKDGAGNETAPARGDFVRLGNDTVKGITQDTNGFLWMLNKAGQIVASQ